MKYPKVYIIILNYNGWADTIECLESVLRSDYPNYQVVVVDNNSPDDSMEYIEAWAEGKLDVWVKPDHPLRHLSSPPVKKPIPYVYYDREKAEKDGNNDWKNGLMVKPLNSKKEIGQLSTNQPIPHSSISPFNLLTTEPINYSIKYPLVLIQTGENLGFAGGNNVGLRYALAKDDFEYIWLLNNDTVIEKNALSMLIQKFENYRKSGERIGVVGSKLLYYSEPNIIQGVGGIYNKWFAVGKHLGVFEKDKGQYDNEDEALSKIDYIIGASMLISKGFLEEIGLLCEDYFLYFEEMDWVLRGKQKGYGIGYCHKSKVYHKEGESIGSSLEGKEKSEIADFYGLRNRIIFTKKFYPQYLWSVYFGFVFVIWNRIRRRQLSRIKTVFKALLDGRRNVN